jgi:dipeptidyl-peptidase-4
MQLVKRNFGAMTLFKKMTVSLLFVLISICSFPQRGNINWSADGNSYYQIENNELVKYTLPDRKKEVIISRDQLTPAGSEKPLSISYYKFTDDMSKALLFTNTKKVWRLHTKGDYWIIDFKSGTLKQLGKTLPESSLMFAKISPDGKSVAYVSNQNIYVEDLATSMITPLTTDGTVTLINGTFDWAYEEEFYCRDGFRWSPDSKSIAYWQLDASKIRKFYMINNTDSIYSRIIPLEYPVAGQNPSSCRVGIVNISSRQTKWLNIPGDPVQHYIVRMEFIPGNGNLLIQQLNRKQNVSRLYIANVSTGEAKLIQEESDDAWVDIYQPGNPYTIDFTNNFIWMNDGKSILWTTEKDGWRHMYEVSLEGKAEKLITRGDFDVIDFKYLDLKKGYLYYTASPDNATQQYLFRTKLNGKGDNELLTPGVLKGTNGYSISPNGKYAFHTFSNVSTRPAKEFITLPDCKSIDKNDNIIEKLDSLKVDSSTELFKVTTSDNVTMDGWIVKPDNFDPSKKYPVVFYVYTEPAATTVTDTYGVGFNRLYLGNMARDGYIYISIDNRGTPAPKGRAWRKAIYKNIGKINIHDQAMAAKEIFKWGFIDTTRVAVWGWSGGGSATLNLMFQYPDIYKTGIAIAAVANELTYDNIYQERYMGLPEENINDFVTGSPIYHAKNLKGNLLYIHGTGDDNVHYQNAEMLINELVKYNKQFQFMAYPNRTHSINEGKGTSLHLATLYTNYLRTHCPPGAK